MTEKTIHEGRNVKRIREILGIKQDALALELGISQQAISALEQKEALDKEMLEKVAKALNGVLFRASKFGLSAEGSRERFKRKRVQNAGAVPK